MFQTVFETGGHWLTVPLLARLLQVVVSMLRL
jgi:hypothetical protein